MAFASNSAQGPFVFEGLLWLDSSSGVPRRIFAELPGDTPISMDMNYSPVRFESAQTTVLLPRDATVSAHHIRLESRSVHRFSDYQLSGINQNGVYAGTALSGIVRPLDAVELLGEAAESLDMGTKEALVQRVLGLEPERPETHFQIAMGLWRNKLLPQAELEHRSALKEAPGASEVHNLLGIVLFGRGDTTGAVSEFRASEALQPGNATAHLNLTEALKKAPRPASAAAEAPIRVDVRQVLVPVVVTRDGHHVSDLSRDDFHVFEDGVEQKIVAFSVERASLKPAEGAPASGPAGSSGREGNASGGGKAKYLVCIDALHTSFSSLADIRQAMVKLFGEEQEGRHSTR